jgi:hypothetical protein
VFRVPSAGKLTVVWTVTVSARELAIARFTARYRQAGTSAVTIRLTAAGRRLLEAKRSIAVHARLSFAPVNQTAAIRQREFTLST